MENLNDYDYTLPPDRIAQVPAPDRSASRLLVLRKETGEREHTVFGELSSYLRDGDTLVLNNTRVIPARIEASRRTGGQVELFLLEPGREGDWTVLAKPSGRLKEGERLNLRKGGEALLKRFCGGGEWEVSFEGIDSRDTLFSRGRMPLPHYIRREKGEDERDSLDRERYQTVYAARDGAVAAPTAGLHFTPELLDRLASIGVSTVFVTLHVGAGTFSPVREDDFRKHLMHEERYTLSEEAARSINETRSRGGRIVGVGTTAARVLETLANDEGIVFPGSGRTGIYIYPPYRFKALDALVTNFHLPRSTLLLLVSAFAQGEGPDLDGRRKILTAYEEAVRLGYRFYSYGDAMLIM